MSNQEKYSELKDYTRILLKKFYDNEGNDLGTAVGRVLYELEDDISEDTFAKYVIYTELINLTLNKGNKGLTRDLANELMPILQFIRNLVSDGNVIEEKIQRELA